MHPTRIVRGTALVVSLQLAAPLVLAQQKPPSASVDPADAASAKKHFDLGLKLYKEKEYEAALLEFDQSYQLGKRPSALRNKAQTLRDLKRSAEAYYAYEMLLKVHEAELKTAEKLDTQRAMDELKMLTGEVILGVDQADADVYVDGKQVGKSPLPAIRFNAGPHKVKVTKQGFDPAEADFTAISLQKVTVPIHLSPEVTTGHVTVKEQNAAPGVHVFVDGKDVGPAPWEGDLAPGSHLIEVRGEKVASESRPVDVPLKGKIDVVLLAVATMGTVSITAEPSIASIAIDGVEKGKGKFEGEVPPGSHQLTVSLNGYDTFQASIVVERGKPLTQKVVLVETKTVTLGDNKPKEIEWDGMFARLGFFGLFPLHTPHYSECNEGEQCTTTKTTAFGLGADFRLGYSFGIVALEATLAGMVDFRSNTRAYPGYGRPPNQFTTVNDEYQRDELYAYIGVGAFAGGGMRITSHGSFARVTLGASLGGVFKNMWLRRETQGLTSISDSYSTSANYVAPGMLLDAGVLMGTTAGTRLMLGVMAWIDAPKNPVATEDQGTRNATYNPGAIPGLPIPSGAPSSVPYPTPSFPLATGTQFYIGPRLGLEFGH